MKQENGNIIELSHLTKRFGETKALDDFSLSVREGELFGLLGPNGAGKTTAIFAMLGLYPIDEGEMRLFGRRMPEDAAYIKARVGIVPQQISVYEDLTVRENIAFFGQLYGLSKEEARHQADAALAFVQLSEQEKKFPRQLSGGMMRRLNIACGIVHRPKLIFMDEPTVAIDPQSRNTILENIRQLNRDGATIIYTSHYMEEVELLCHRVAIMDTGRVIAEGTPDELKELVTTVESLRIHAPRIGQATIGQIGALSFVQNVRVEGEEICADIQKGASVMPVLELLQEDHVAFTTVSLERPTLNSVFLTLTGKALRE
ncbi:ABC transporter ATP-binding protein [Exiguobacterium flavidum]|uniref:ABC transporter ATP-binding protein n=1 Tax=Exiguobacterium flavidum TaxID=2184695 RepID=UPI000DF733D7|nr:ABC transporter ATP-binding protein [Exiguobacterium flavidum]